MVNSLNKRESMNSRVKVWNKEYILYFLWITFYFIYEVTVIKYLFVNFINDKIIF